MTQYIACAFWETATRTYTYHNDGDPVAVGDVVRIETPEGGWKRVTVREIVGKPTFPTKPITGRFAEDNEPKPEDADAPASEGAQR